MNGEVKLKIVGIDSLNITDLSKKLDLKLKTLTDEIVL